MFFRASHWWDSEQLTFMALVTDTSKTMREESQAPPFAGVQLLGLSDVISDITEFRPEDHCYSCMSNLPSLELLLII